MAYSRAITPPSAHIVTDITPLNMDALIIVAISHKAVRPY